ncbi:hypothetical protein Avbf_09453 [Armadillidium vulgare]|nr:hypothetical protein Avbf_09453 [Armadillidium vulgare]
MLRLFPNSSLLIHFLRILGHFPYARTSGNMIENENSDSVNCFRKFSKRECDIFTPSKFWKVWSLAFCLVNTLLIIYNIAGIKHLSERRTYGIETIRAPYIIYDSLLYINLFSMNFLSIKNSHKLSKILNKLHAFISTTKIENKKFGIFDLSWVAPYIVLIAVTGLLFIIGIFTTAGTLYEVVFSDFTSYAKSIEDEYGNSPLLVSYNKRKTSYAFATATFKTINCSENVENLSTSIKRYGPKLETKITLSSIKRYECRFCLFTSDHRIRVYQRPHERYVRCHIAHVRTFSGGSVKGLGGVSMMASTKFHVIVGGFLKAQRYITDINEPFVVSFAPFIGSEFLLMQDNDRPDVTALVQGYLNTVNINTIV